MNKTSNFSGLTMDMILDRLKRHALPMAGIGASTAAIAHLLSLKQQAEKQNEQNKSPDQLIIEIPEKTAETAGQYFWDAPLAVGSSVAGGTLGFAIVNSILQKRRQQQLNNELDSVKNQYSSYLSKDISSDSKEASFPCLSGLVFSLTEKVNKIAPETHRKEAAINLIKNAQTPPAPETIGTLLTSLPTLGALLAGVVTHKLYYDKQKNFQRGLEKEEASNSDIAPKLIKIVTKKNSPDSAVESNSEVNVDELLMDNKKTSMDVSTGFLINQAAKERENNNTDSQSRNSEKVEKRQNPIISKKDIQKLDKNTLMMLTDSGEIKVDALDPHALAILEKHKNNILRSLAAGLNT
jgi:hypothetical protein